MLGTKGKRIAAIVGLLSGAILAAALWFVFQDSQLRLLAPVAGLFDASVVYYVFSKNFEQKGTFAGDDGTGV